MMNRALLVLPAALALWTGVAQAACVPPRQAVPQSAVDQFNANPQALLDRYPGGEGGLQADIRNFVVSDPSTLASVRGLVAKAQNQAQRSAIGAGLGQAAVVCRRPDADFARTIQQAIVGIGPGDVATAFNLVTGDTATTATGGGAGGGSGGGGGGVGSTAGGSGSAVGILQPALSSFTNPASGFSSGSGLLADATTTRTQAVVISSPGTTAPTSVSPAQ